MSAPARHLKGLVLAGGTGSRLRPFTLACPKQLVPIANKPVLFYAIEDLVRAGIREIGVVVGHAAAQICAALGAGERFGAHLAYLHQGEPLGLAHAALCARDWLGDDPFVLYLGDNLLPEGIGDLVGSFLAGDAAAQLLLAPVAHPERYGVAVLEGERVIRLVEKPAIPPSDLAVLGVYCFDRRILEAASSIAPSARGELELTDAIQWLIDRGEPVGYRRLEGRWVDTGTREDLLAANRLVLETASPAVRGEVDAESRLTGAVTVEAGARIVRSVLRGPLVVGAGAVVRDSVIGPFTAIGESCELSGCAIADSIVMAHSRIAGTGRPIEASIIGRHARIGRADHRPPSFRLTLGDHSTLVVP